MCSKYDVVDMVASVHMFRCVFDMFDMVALRLVWLVCV